MPDALVIRGATLIDGTGAGPVSDAVIVIEDGRVSAAGPSASVARPDGAETIEACGLWAVPGLIDTHIHLELTGREALPVYLALGVTTARDLGGALDFLVGVRRSLEDGAAGPRLLFSGPMVDGEPPTWPSLVRPTADAGAATRAVREHLDAGADAIKLYTTLPPDSLRASIEEVGGSVPVTGHLGRTLASEAMEVGINGLEHALLTPYNDLVPDELRTGPDETMSSPAFWQKVSAGWLEVDLAGGRVGRWIDLLVERDVSFCPTLTVAPGAGDQPEERELRYAPRVAERWLEATRQRQAQPLPPEFQEGARRMRAKLQELVLGVHRAGGRIVAGTDTGAVRSLVPGFSLHRELRLLADAGLPAGDVLRTATARAAEALGRDDLGTIAPGKRADLLLLRADPLGDIGALREIQRVVHDGQVFDPAALLARAEEQEASEGDGQA